MTPRARFAVLAPDLAKGVRAAIATVVPFYLAGALHHRELAWVALGGWLGSLSDPGGARRTRGVAAVAFLVFGSAAIGLGALAATTVPTAAIGLAALVFLSSLAGALGATARSVGNIIAIAATIAAARPGDPVEAAWFAVGVAWAAVMSTMVWPVWPHVTLRLAIGRVFDRLADYVDAVASAQPDDWAELARRHQRSVRAAIDDARATALAMRARRTGESPAGSNLRALVGSAEELFFRTIALAEAVERGGTIPANLAAAMRAIARDLYERRAGVVVEVDGDEPVADFTRALAAVARDIDQLPHATAPPAAPYPHWSLQPVRDALSSRGPVVIHAVRVAALAAAAVALARAITPATPTWLPVTAVAVLQPYLGATVVRAIERVAGTLLGAVVTLALISVIHDPVVLAALMFPLAVVAVVTRPRSYRLFVVFLTPVFVLVTDLDHVDWHTDAARVLDVALGGGLALIAALIAPSRERPRLEDAVAAVIAATASYARVATGTSARGEVVAARRALGAALEGAEASLERMLAEPAPLRGQTERAMYVVTYARRLAAGITDLLESGGALPFDVVDYIAGTATTPPATASPAVAVIVRRGGMLARALASTPGGAAGIQ